jgi:multidrug efflux pump subunit AcrA (membrane-fusion protein)
MSVAAVLFLCLYKPMYRVSAPFQFTPIEPRTISMPFEEQIVKVNVKPGQKVKQGDVLVELRTFNLINRRQEANLAAYEARKQADSLRSQGKFGESEVARYKFERALQDVDLYDRQIAEAKVIAPFDGEILSSNVEDKLNTTPKQGDELLQMARQGDLHAEIKVSEADVSNVFEPKMDGHAQVGYIATTSDR